MKKLILFSTVLASLFIFSCKSDLVDTSITNAMPVLPDNEYNYASLNLPDGVFPAGTFIDFGFPGNGFPDIDINIDPTFNNGSTLQITDAGATLGRVLFYDKQLSISNTISCGSCHIQSKAFADGKKFSPGFEGKMTERNSMSIVNPISQNNLFWDSRSFSIVDLSLKPVQNHIEMGMENLNFLVEKLGNAEYYPALFQKAFGTPDITQERISKAMAQFVGSITTSDSRFDKGQLSQLEQLGHQIFNSEKAMCNQCHGGNNFAAQDGPFDPYGGGGSNGLDLKGTTNIGLELVAKDKGKDNGNFKIPSLRNIELTGPYMHDGRFETLEQVIDHYSKGIKSHPNLDEKFINEDGSVKRLNFTNVEKTALIAFLKSLTDESLLTDPKYSDPFKL
jgi:cytochrome c peroxidase